MDRPVVVASIVAVLVVAALGAVLYTTGSSDDAKEASDAAVGDDLSGDGAVDKAGSSTSSGDGSVPDDDEENTGTGSGSESGGGGTPPPPSTPPSTPPPPEDEEPVEVIINAGPETFHLRASDAACESTSLLPADAVATSVDACEVTSNVASTLKVRFESDVAAASQSGSDAEATVFVKADYIPATSHWMQIGVRHSCQPTNSYLAVVSLQYPDLPEVGDGWRKIEMAKTLHENTASEECKLIFETWTGTNALSLSVRFDPDVPSAVTFTPPVAAQ